MSSDFVSQKQQRQLLLPIDKTEAYVRPSGDECHIMITGIYNFEFIVIYFWRESAIIFENTTFGSKILNLLTQNLILTLVFKPLRRIDIKYKY